VHGSRSLTALLPAFALLLALPAVPAAQAPVSEETVKFFKQNCASCHTVGGGRLTGPDLTGLMERRDRDWLVEFLIDPKGVIDSGDPYAAKILSESRGVYMPAVPGMTKELAGKLIDLVEIEDGLERSQFAGVQLSERPLTDQDVAIGRALFTGERSLESGGPACNACHDVAGIGAFGGGRLGPDLTSAYARLEGRKALGAWLSAPPSAVMQPLFVDRPLDSEEILQLVAFLESTAKQGAPPDDSNLLKFSVAGIGLAALLMVAFDLAWRNRFRGVRRTLVEQS
jgi:mono/diheme cytochrome c family protein